MFEAAKPFIPRLAQKLIVKHLLEHAEAGVFADVGVGKTSAVLATFRFLRKRGLAKRMLIVAPLRVAHLVWPIEARKWQDFHDLKVAVLHGSKREELLASDADVCVVNYEGLDWLTSAMRVTSPTGRLSMQIDLKRFRTLGFDTLVMDELTRVKHVSSGRHKTLRTIAPTFERRWGLTGTPVPNGLIDLFGQALVLDLGKAFGRYVTHYRRDFFLPSYDGFGWILQKDAEKRIYERLRPLVIRLAAADYVDMPELVEIINDFDLPTGARRVYDALEDDLITRVGEHVIIASNVAAASTKLRQVTAGAIYLSDVPDAVRTKLPKRTARDYVELHDAKLDALVDLIEELNGQPLLVAYDFRHDLERLQKRLNAPVIGGGTSTKNAARIEADWNAGRIPVLLGHPASIGHGLNLQGAGNHVAWFSLTWDRELYDQLIGRVRRSGSRHDRVFVHHLLARNTVDETIYFALRRKARVQDALLAALQRK
jgi:SNF2 family DNA or RNA helicase